MVDRPEELAQLQSIELAIYKAVAGVCLAHGLRFYALGGTLLGAVREGGFIPWDDDVDIALSRPDYERFVEVARAELPANLVVRTYRDFSAEMPAPYFCQVQKYDSSVVLESGGQPRRTSIWIDVFPLDAMPTNGLLRTIHKYRLLYHRMKIQFSMYEMNAHLHRANRPLHERALMKFREVTKLGADWNTVEMFEQLERCCKRYDLEEQDYFVNVMGAYKFREMFPKAWFGEGVELPFEDTTILCPVEYDKVLTRMYGDYMTPPEGEHRYDQHRLVIESLGAPL